MAREAGHARAAERLTPGVDAQRGVAITGPRHEHITQLAADLNASASVARLARTSDDLNARAVQRAAPPPAPNRTGLPDRLKQGVEAMSGLSLDHVRVHLNSSRPAQLNALAYAQGADIHVAPGQAHQLPHEAWHVVQQAQGRVRPTLRAPAGVAINDDPALEREADRMGALAPTVQRVASAGLAGAAPSRHGTAQLAKGRVARLKAKKERAEAAKPKPTPAETLEREDDFDDDEGSTNYVIATEGRKKTPYEEVYSEPQLFWRGDTRAPDAVFKTGFTSQNERNKKVKPGANRIIWRNGGGLDDILPASAVCLAKDIRGSAFFPLTDESDFYLYAVFKRRVVSTVKAQMQVEARETGEADFQREERYQYDPAYEAGDQASAVWQFQEHAAHRVESNEIVAAFAVERRTLVNPGNQIDDVSMAGIQFKLTFDSLNQNDDLAPEDFNAMLGEAEAAAAPYEDFYPQGDEFLSYMGKVMLLDATDHPTTLAAAPGKVEQTQPLVYQARRAPVPTRLAATSSAPIQRLVIARAATPWLAADFDTANLLLCKQVISGLRAGGKRQELMDLHFQLSKIAQAQRTDNDKTLIASLDEYLNMKTSAVAENAQSPQAERTAIEEQYRAAPAVAPAVRAGLRMWITGDPNRGVNWEMIGKHLRGRLTDEDYRLIGVMSHARAHPGAPDPDGAALILLGRQTLNAATNDISGALGALPDHVGATFRQAGVANARVYGGKVNLGDYIRDTTFWSTSALRISGSAGGWGVDGAKAKPKVYFIIQGTTGKYISKAAEQEQGQHEVLYSQGATFLVTGITNVRSETIFVYITQVDPATLPANTVVRNPFNGDAY